MTAHLNSISCRPTWHRAMRRLASSRRRRATAMRSTCQVQHGCLPRIIAGSERGRAARRRLVRARPCDGLTCHRSCLSASRPRLHACLACEKSEHPNESTQLTGACRLGRRRQDRPAMVQVAPPETRTRRRQASSWVHHDTALRSSLAHTRPRTSCECLVRRVRPPLTTEVSSRRVASCPQMSQLRRRRDRSAPRRDRRARHAPARQ